MTNEPNMTAEQAKAVSDAEEMTKLVIEETKGMDHNVYADVCEKTAKDVMDELAGVGECTPRRALELMLHHVREANKAE